MSRSSRRSKGLVFCFLGGLFWLLGLDSSVVQASVAMGMAGAYSLQARGVEAPLWNPAVLAWSNGFSLRLFSAAAAVSNNSFSLKDYNRWNGAAWSESDKQSILGRIPGAGLEGDFDVRADGPGVAWNGWALTEENYAVGRTRLPREFARLILLGNDPQETFDLGGSDGEGMAWSELRLSHGHALSQLAQGPWGTGPWLLAVGVNARFLRGWAYGEVLQATGGFRTGMDGLEGETDLRGRTAQGGSGFGCDLGLAAHLPGDWDLGLTVQNAFSRVTWSRRPEERTERAYADSVTADNLDQQDDLVTQESSRTAVSAFSTSLPASVGLAASHRWGPVSLEADLRQGFSRGFGGSTLPRFAVGAAYPPWSFLEARAGLALGGSDRSMLAGGLGIFVWRIRLDLAAAAVGGVNPFAPKGVGCSASLGLR